MHRLLIAQGGHEPPVDHGVVLLAVVLIAALGVLVYGLFRLVRKSVGSRQRSDRGVEDDQATGS